MVDETDTQPPHHASKSIEDGAVARTLSGRFAAVRFAGDCVRLGSALASGETRKQSFDSALSPPSAS